MWTTPSDVRKLVGLPSSSLDPDYASDSVLQYYIERAQYAILPMVSILVRDDQLSGSINGSNTEFYVSNYPIFDSNFDKSINASDITVYGWGDLDDLDTKTSLSVSSVDWREGRVVLSSAPSSTFEALTADYRYSKYEVDWNLLDMATAYLAGYLYLTAEYMEIPLNVRTGAQTYRYTYDPATRCLETYLRMIDLIRKKIVFRGKKE